MHIFFDTTTLVVSTTIANAIHPTTLAFSVFNCYSFDVWNVFLLNSISVIVARILKVSCQGSWLPCKKPFDEMVFTLRSHSSFVPILRFWESFSIRRCSNGDTRLVKWTNPEPVQTTRLWRNSHVSVRLLAQRIEFSLKIYPWSVSSSLVTLRSAVRWMWRQFYWVCIQEVYHHQSLLDNFQEMSLLQCLSLLNLTFYL